MSVPSVAQPEKEEEAKKEKTEEDLEKKVLKQIASSMKADTLAIEKEKMGRRANYRSFLTQLHMERKEAETEVACTNAKESEGWRIEEVKQENKLAEEMTRDKMEELRQLKLRQQLRDCEELRELQKQLRIAYVQKDLATQLAEKQAAEYRRRYFSEEERRIVQNQAEACAAYEEMEKVKAAQRQKSYRESLQDQMIDRQKEKEGRYRDLLQEKAFLDESLRTIMVEDLRDKELKSLKIQKAKEDEAACKKAKAIWIKREKELQEAEDRRIRKYREDKEKLEKILQEENKKREVVKTQNKITCMSMIQQSEDERLERNRIANILLDEDARRRSVEKARMEEEQDRQRSQEFREVSARQIEHRLLTIEEQRRQDRDYVNQMRLENERALKQEKEENLKKKQEMINYGKSLEEIMAAQQFERLKETQRMTAERKVILQRQIDSRKLIEEERLNILKVHASKLVGYLPRGVLKESDMEHLDPDVRSYYKR